MTVALAVAGAGAHLLALQLLLAPELPLQLLLNQRLAGGACRRLPLLACTEGPGGVGGEAPAYFAAIIAAR